MMTVKQLQASLAQIVEAGHGDRPIYIWLPGQWMYPSEAVIPTGQDYYAMIEANVCPGQSVDTLDFATQPANHIPFGVVYVVSEGKHHAVFKGQIQKAAFEHRGAAHQHLMRLKVDLEKPDAIEPVEPKKER